MTLKHKAISGVKWNLLATAIGVAVQFVTLIVLVRILTPSDFGLMGMIMVVIGFGQLFSDMGMSSAIIYQQDATEAELSSLYWLNIFVGIAIFLVLCAVSPLVIAFYHEPRLKGLLFTVAFVFVITPFGQQYEVLLQKDLEFNKLASTQMLHTLANALSTILFALSGFGVMSLVLGLLCGSSLKVLLLLMWGSRIYKPRFHFRRTDLRRYVSFGFFQLGDKTINYFNSHLDYLLIGSMLGAKALGYYTLAWNLVLRPPTMINPIINRVTFPVFAKVQNQLDKLKKGYLKTLQLLTLANFPILVGLCAGANTIIPIVFGDRWSDSIIIVQILAVVAISKSVSNPTGSLLLSKGRADLGFKWNASLVLGQMVGLYVGARAGGLIGISTAYAILFFTYNILEYRVIIRRMLGPCLRDYISSIIPALWIAFVMGVAMFLVFVCLRKVVPPRALLTIQLVTGVSVYIGLFVSSYRPLFYELKNTFFPVKSKRTVQ